MGLIILAVLAAVSIAFFINFVGIIECIIKNKSYLDKLIVGSIYIIIGLFALINIISM
ncbi:MAG: hypothetical protein N2594_03060 [Clostridiales bacterium]|nr:hypothetical protein [Clostridiales bacterium]